MDLPSDDGATRRQHLESAARQLGKRPEALNGPPFPHELHYLWAWFVDIHAGRTVNGMAHTRATQLDIWAWQQNNGMKLEPWEIRAVMALGSTWLTVQHDAVPKKQPPTKR